MDNHNDFFLDETADAPATPQADSRQIQFNQPAASSSDTPGQPPRPRRHRVRNLLIWTVIIGLLVLAGVFYVRYLNPYAQEAQATGYVTSIEKRGIIFKTFEGTMATEQAMGDSTRVYTRDFSFTVPSDSLARRIQALSTPPGRCITLVYEKYYGTLPWRGASKNVVTAIR
jgi:hypothetical protein